MAEGVLTGTQYEIMQIVWKKGRCGASVGAIWKQICETRDVSRTTILKLVDRLEKRGFLFRQEARPNQTGNAKRYVANVSRRKTCAKILKKFVDDYYDGSASSVVEALLKFKCLSDDEIKNLRRALRERVATSATS